MNRECCEVAVVGAGPVGLLLGCRLAQLGIDVRVLERETEPSLESRALGIHPPGLSCLSVLDVADKLTSRGVPVRRAFVFRDREPLGSISLSSLTPPFDYVLSVPRQDTESILEARLEELQPGALQRGEWLIGATEREGGARLQLRSEAGLRELDAAFVVGCDGKQSMVRRAMGEEYSGGAYRSWFVMGDVPDCGFMGPHAAVHLSRAGLVESFPLPGGRRRWIASTADRRLAPDVSALRRIVAERTGYDLPEQPTLGTSSFPAEHFIAHRLTRGRFALVGDAAHVVSPIGAQGMNLGWLGAWSLASNLERILRHGASYEPLFKRYDRERHAAARAATRLAQIFMSMGEGQGGQSWLAMRDACVKLLLSPFAAPRVARMFT